MLWPVVKALLGHYRRYPLQICLVWLGLTLGVSLLVGVTAINHHARQSYEHGEKLFSNPLPILGLTGVLLISIKPSIITKNINNPNTTFILSSILSPHIHYIK